MTAKVTLLWAETGRRRSAVAPRRDAENPFLVEELSTREEE
ncbi:MAG: hypothetical protein NZU74_18140 [Chloroflexaceae bacterium]|nr:hypothetical protein [Chloroflexaceae bacterium]